MFKRNICLERGGGWKQLCCGWHNCETQYLGRILKLRDTIKIGTTVNWGTDRMKKHFIVTFTNCSLFYFENKDVIIWQTKSKVCRFPLKARDLLRLTLPQVTLLGIPSYFDRNFMNTEIKYINVKAHFLPRLPVAVFREWIMK